MYGTAHLQGNVCSRDTREFLAGCSRVARVLPSSFSRVTLESHAMNRPTINRSTISRNFSATGSIDTRSLTRSKPS